MFYLSRTPCVCVPRTHECSPRSPPRPHTRRVAVDARRGVAPRTAEGAPHASVDGEGSARRPRGPTEGPAGGAWGLPRCTARTGSEGGRAVRRRRRGRGGRAQQAARDGASRRRRRRRSDGAHTTPRLDSYVIDIEHLVPQVWRRSLGRYVSRLLSSRPTTALG